MASSVSALARIVSAYSRCSPAMGVSSSRPLIPMTPFSGVRISWLIVARNSDLARLAASASCRRRAISASSKSLSMAMVAMLANPSTISISPGSG